MKKILFALALLVITVNLTANAQNTTRWPWGNPSTKVLTATKAADTITVINNQTYVTVSDTFHAAMTMVVEVDSRVRPGAMLFIKTSCGAVARTITFGTGFTSNTQTGTANKTKLNVFWYDGTKFLAVSASTLN